MAQYPLATEMAEAAAQAAQQHDALMALAVPRDQGLAPRRFAHRPVAPAAPESAAPASGDAAPPEGDPCWWSVAQIAAGYRLGRITPEQLVQAMLNRIATLDPVLHAYVHLDAEGALAAARDPALPRGALYGVPVAIKDMIDVAGMPTTCHSALRLGAVAVRDAPAVAALRAAGAIILGKLATHEFAIGGPSFDLPFPPARNPWNPAHHPGGSSSGAGAAVAAGLAVLALGTDTAGSVRNPASACGIVGLKPTRGLIDCAGVVPLAWSLDHLGILARSVADTGAGLRVLAPVGGAGATPRVGYIRHFHTVDMPATVGMAAALDRAAQALGATEAQLPPLDDFALVNRVILQCEGAAYHEAELRAAPEVFARRTRSALLAGLFANAGDYLLARRAQAMLSDAVEALFTRFDVLLCASGMYPACRIDDDAAIDTTYMAQARGVFNLTGHPALAMMAGVSAQGLPLAIQLAARHGEEGTLLAVAQRWESEMGGPQRPPVAQWLSAP